MNYYPDTEWGRLLAELDRQDRKRTEAMKLSFTKKESATTALTPYTPPRTFLTDQMPKTLGQTVKTVSNVGSVIGLILLAFVLYGASL